METQAETIAKNSKFVHCEEELRVLLKKLIDGNYNITAKIIFDHVANTGVEVGVNPSLKDKMTMEEFIEGKSP